MCPAIDPDAQPSGFDTRAMLALASGIFTVLVSGVWQAHRLAVCMAIQEEKLANLKTDLSKTEANLKADLSKTEANLKADLSKTEANLKADLSKTEANLKADLTTLKADLKEALKEELTTINQNINRSLNEGVDAKINKLKLDHADTFFGQSAKPPGGQQTHARGLHTAPRALAPSMRTVRSVHMLSAARSAMAVARRLTH